MIIFKNFLFLIRQGYKPIGEYRGKTVRVWDCVLNTKLYKTSTRNLSKTAKKLIKMGVELGQ